MERAEGFMRGLKLTRVKSRGLKIGQGSLSTKVVKDEHAVGKLLDAKPAILMRSLMLWVRHGALSKV
jgi:hypothetical protein